MKILPIPFQQIAVPLTNNPCAFRSRWYFKCFCFLGWEVSFRLMWLANSVKYRKPFSPQPMQFPEKPMKRKNRPDIT